MFSSFHFFLAYLLPLKTVCPKMQGSFVFSTSIQTVALFIYGCLLNAPPQNSEADVLTY